MLLGAFLQQQQQQWQPQQRSRQLKVKKMKNNNKERIEAKEKECRMITARRYSVVKMPASVLQTIYSGLVRSEELNKEKVEVLVGVLYT